MSRSAAAVPWPLLVSKIRGGEDSPITHAELAQANVDLQPLLDAGLLVRGGAGRYRPFDCEGDCLPTLDFARREGEGLVGVACPQEPACWPGWRWVPRAEMETLRCRHDAVLAALSERNGLKSLSIRLPRPVHVLGWLSARGLTVPVVWIRSPPPAFGQLCEGVRLELGQDGLIVLVGKDPRVRLRAKARIVVLEISCDPRGDLQLTRALDELNPNYRAELLTSPRHDFDHVYLTLATKVGKHHVVMINGEEVPACRHSDLNFLRLLLLATGRKSGENNGAFQLDALRAGNNPHRPILALRNDLNKCKAPNVTKAELGALVHVEGGEIRLRIPPCNIEFDSSLGELACIGATSRPSSNAPKGAGKKGTSTGSRRAIPDGKADSLAAGRATAELLLSDCRRQLEKPAALEVPPTPSSGQRVSFGAKR